MSEPYHKLVEVYLVEIFVEGRWTAMYLPCYSKAEADKKAKIKRKILGEEFRVRVGRYVWEESYGSV